MLARPARLLALVAAALTLATACDGSQAAQPTPTPRPTSSSAVPAGLESYYDQSVDWSGCKDGFDCTKVQVPRDYDHPSAGSIELAVIRHRAKHARGSLLLNPGGPGNSGVEYTRAASVVLTPQVLRAFDVVGFDPRGVASSTPVDCVDDATLDEWFAVDGTPDDQQEVDDLVAVLAQFGQGCERRSPDLAPYLGTESAARDIDIIRSVLGEDQLSFIGKSYGTHLFAMYAELFPQHVHRLVLDGVLPSSLDSDQISLGQAKAFDVALRRFVADCATQEDCPLPHGVDQGIARIQQLIAGLDANPLPGKGDRELTQAMATWTIASYLYLLPWDWDLLRYGLSAAFVGDGSVLVDMMDDRSNRNPDGTFADNGNEAFPAIQCLDRPAVGGADHAAQLAQEWSVEAPVFGAYMAWANLTCWQWPMGAGTAEAAGKPPVVRADGAGPILVVSTKYDPATPYEWGVQVAGELADGHLLTFDGDGHTAYTSGSSCIDAAVDAYLLEGTLPAEGTVCEPDEVDASGA